MNLNDGITANGGREDMKCYDWFFCTKELSEEKILDKILKKEESMQN